jgi:manganese-dependent inorganic pyrophosphatase
VKKIIVTGHRNPDMDSVCAAWAYAHYKNRLCSNSGESSEKSCEYLPVRCGHLNNQTKETFKDIGIEPPRLMKDVYPRVGDILSPLTASLTAEDPVLSAIKTLHDYNISILPVFSPARGKSLAGLVSVQEISDFLINEQVGERPLYTFRVENFEKVLPGALYLRGGSESFRAPVMVGAMPYPTSVSRIEQLLPLKPVLVVGARPDIITYAIREQFPALILTGVTEQTLPAVDFTGFKGTVFLSTTDTAETVRLLRLSAPVEDIMGTDYPEITEDTHFDDAKKLLIGSEFRGLPVFSSGNNGTFLGIVTRRCFIDRPHHRIILVDHNEAAQSIRGIEHADIIEIIDHHRLAPEKTRTPIYMAAKPVGSTCTIIFQHYQSSGYDIDTVTAQVLLAGILSDTVLLKSPTTTAEDQRAAEKLAQLGGVDYLQFGHAIFQRTALLSEYKPEEVVHGDFKVYKEFGYTVGISQIEVVTMEDLKDTADALRKALDELIRDHNLDWAMLMISNVLKEKSKLLSRGAAQLEKGLVYSSEGDGLFDLPGILSRKKQLLPEVLRVLEESRERA